MAGALMTSDAKTHELLTSILERLSAIDSKIEAIRVRGLSTEDRAHHEMRKE